MPWGLFPMRSAREMSPVPSVRYACIFFFTSPPHVSLPLLLTSTRFTLVGVHATLCFHRYANPSFICLCTLYTLYRFYASLMHNLQNEMVWRLCYILDVTKKLNETGLLCTLYTFGVKVHQPNGVEVRRLSLITPDFAPKVHLTQLFSHSHSELDSTTSGCASSQPRSDMGFANFCNRGADLASEMQRCTMLLQLVSCTPLESATELHLFTPALHLLSNS